MKRQHPDNPELFWCGKCHKYEKYFRKWSNTCRKCEGKRQRERDKLLRPGYKTEINRRYYRNNPEKGRESTRRWAKNNPDKKIEIKRKYILNNPEMSARFSALNFFSRHGITSPSDELMNIKIQQIIMKRTIKELKKWRKENDPTITDVSGIESQDETADERA